jgi:hypothetical protein
LAPYGRIRAWPRGRDTHRGVGVSFVLSLPPEFKQRVRLHIGKNVFVVRPGTSRRVHCVNASGPVDRLFSTHDITLTPTLERLSVRMTNLRVVDGMSGSGCTGG